MASSKLAEMFSDAPAEQRGELLEKTKKYLRESRERMEKGVDGFIPAPRNNPNYQGPIGIVRGAGEGFRSMDRRAEQAAEKVATIAKSMSDEQRIEVEAALAEIRGMQGEYRDMVGKDITVASPGNLHPYDLEGLHWLVPYFYLLSRDIPRSKGQGTAREFRRVLGFTNTGLGGVADQLPFFNSESDTGAPVFGSLTLRRGPKIQYATDSKVVPYVEMSVSDEVTDKAYFSDLGFENVDELSAFAMLWAHKLGEEKSNLYARGSMAGFSGAVAAPVISTATATTGGTIAAATYFFKVTARAGGGESLPSAEVSQVTTGATSTVTINVTTEPVGALGYNLYASASTGTEKFITSFVGNSVTITVTPAGSVAVPGADSTANPNGYDGFLTVQADPNQSGYVARVNAPLFTPGGSNNLGDKPFQDMFASLFNSVYADPDEAWITAPIGRELLDFVRAQNGGAAAYRITLQDTGSVTLGGAVAGIQNESSPSHKIVDLRIHPYMPAGCSFTRQRTLDIPNSGIADTSAMVEVQGYMAVDWARIQFMRERSTYWYGVLLHYAPKWGGCLLGIQ